MTKAQAQADTAATAPPAIGEPNKDDLYGRYQKQEDQLIKEVQDRHKLGMKMAHKALDIPQQDPDPVTINANKSDTRTGMGPLGVLGVALGAGLPGVLTAAVLGWSMLHGGGATTIPPIVPPIVKPVPPPVPGKTTHEDVTVDYEAVLIPPKQ